MAAVLLFRDTNMAAVTSRENTLYMDVLIYTVPTNLLQRTTHAKQITATIISTKAPLPEAAAINFNGRFPMFPDKKEKVNKMKPGNNCSF